MRKISLARKNGEEISELCILNGAIGVDDYC